MRRCAERRNLTIGHAHSLLNRKCRVGSHDLSVYQNRIGALRQKRSAQGKRSPKESFHSSGTPFIGRVLQDTTGLGMRGAVESRSAACFSGANGSADGWG